MSEMKKERWSEDEVLGLPPGELDYFDRKGGAFLTDPDFLKKLAKALSAFANSGGGHLLLGVRNNGTIDGVPNIYKGRTSTREWLEQVIPMLLSYPLQDFRVHEVIPSTATFIPNGNVVIVIDVGDSMLAPHQDTFSKIYYHRSGGHSVPDPHLYLEILRGREKYPSKEIVCAWRDYVIHPLLSIAIGEQKYLEQKKWTWDRWNKIRSGIGLKELHYVSDRRAYSANKEQFLESCPEIQEAMDEHDKAVKVVGDRCEELVNAIKQSNHLLDIYLKATTSESLQALAVAYPDELGSYKTDEAILSRMFGSTEREKHLAILAEYIVNELEEFHSGNTTTPFWNTYRDKFLVAFKYPPISHYWAKADAAREELLRRLEILIGLLKKTLSELTRKHGVPVEVHKESTVFYGDPRLHY